MPGGLERPTRRTGAPLAGLRVMVTRAHDQAGDFAQSLQEAGASVVELPIIAIEPLAIPDQDVRFKNLDRYDWIIFTSVNGIDRFFALLREIGAGSPAAARFAAIGAETAAHLTSYGFQAEIVPERFVAEALAGALSEAGMGGKRILLPRAAGARDVLPERLRALGADVDVVEVYRAVSPPGVSSKLKEHLAAGVDVVTFTSSSTVRNFVDALNGVARFPRSARVACIGPITAAMAREAGLPVDIIAEEYTTRGLVEALVQDRVKQREQTA